jgi:uncharacterized protein (TIGR03790 family)
MKNQRLVFESLIRRSRVLLFLACLAGAVPTRAQNPLAQRVLVVYDPTSSDSVNVANHYLAARGIPAANLCAISPSEVSTLLTWSAYVSEVQNPIQNCLNTVGPNQILYIVLGYIRPFKLTAQNGKVYAIDQYVADIWNQYSATDAFP